MGNDSEYERNNVGFDDQYPAEEGGGIKCKNYQVCGAILPKWWFSCKECYLCTNCDMMFGKALEFIGTIEECVICLDCQPGMTQPNCTHAICVSCFKRCYGYCNDDAGQPTFPYTAAIEHEYDKDPNNPKWQTDYPLLQVYEAEWILWDDAKYLETQRTARCPLCRA
jgi:hypothetical protein